MASDAKFDIKAERAEYKAARKTIRDIKTRAKAALKVRMVDVVCALQDARELQAFSDDLDNFLSERD